MITENVLQKQALLSKMLLKNGDDELNKDLKVKIIKARIEYNKVRRVFDDDVKEFSESIDLTKVRELQEISERTEEQNKELVDEINKCNSEINKYVETRVKDEILATDLVFTQEEFEEILVVNVDNNVEINGNNLTSDQFIGLINELFVKD